MTPKRIISLLPSSTEIVCALGLRDYLVGRSHECDYPLQVQDLPVCSYPKYRSEGTSADINREVETILRESLSIYRIETGKIKALKPTHIITQSQCKVCAVSTDELQQALKEYLKEDKIEVIDLNPENLEQALNNISTIADSLDVHKSGEWLIYSMQKKLEEIHLKTQFIKYKPTVAHIEWIEPIMVAGHWMMSLLDISGGINLFPDENNRWIKFEDIAIKNPDKIVIAPCGFSIETSKQNLYFLETQTGWGSLNAVKNKEIYIADGSHFFNRPGPRLTDSAGILAEIFHPETFIQKHNPDAWINHYKSVSHAKN